MGNLPSDVVETQAFGHLNTLWPSSEEYVQLEKHSAYIRCTHPYCRY